MKKTIIICLSCFIVFSGVLWIAKACKEEITEVVFTAEVLEITEYSLLVNGLGWARDDVNYLGKIFVAVTNSDYEVELLDAPGEPITLFDFAEGDTVEITFDGVTLESNPGKILGTYKIQKVE
ncbi:MAG: hypothetical protein FWH08_05795 [Oscillospiraceae bacterium]|nr:hypothetical protein [Oscillospiraceae bacterium]